MEIKWNRQPQECEGTYMFNGKLFISSGVQDQLAREEIEWILQDLRTLVDENDGINYMVVYLHEETNQKLFFIDQLNKEMVESGKYIPEHNHATLILAEEY